MTEDVDIAVVIDVFRAFSTACYVLEKSPSAYFYSHSDRVLEKLSNQVLNPFFIGKPEKGSKLSYHIPNSPAHVLKEGIESRTVLHRSVSGAKGILSVKEADLVLGAGFINAKATVRYIKSFKNSTVTILPMGFEATTSSLEDELCARYLESLIKSYRFDLSSHIPELKSGAGKYFFSMDQYQYPQEDFEMCLELNKFNFAIHAHLYSDYASLSRRCIDHLDDTFELKAVSILSKNP